MLARTAWMKTADRKESIKERNGEEVVREDHLANFFFNASKIKR